MSRQTGIRARATGSRNATALAAIGAALLAGALAKGAAAQDVLPVPPAPFKGQIGLSA